MLRILLLLPFLIAAQTAITIDGQFADWQNVTTVVNDPSHDEHDTDWYGDHLAQPVSRKYADVDIVQVKFTHDRENLYGYVKATGVIGRTARAVDGQKSGRYYFIITIDVDNDDITGYPLQEGNYWPNSIGYDMNMEVEFYDGSFNTGHYILHAHKGESELAQGRLELAQHMVRLAPGNYDDYLQWVVFPDSSFTYVADRGPVIESGIIKVAVSADGHEAEMKAPMWGFYRKINGEAVVKLGDIIDVSVSLEGSGELSEGAMELGYAGQKSLWGSDTADPIVGYMLKDPATSVEHKNINEPSFRLEQNYPNPFNAGTMIDYTLDRAGMVCLAIYNMLGQHVITLKNEYQSQGHYSAMWDGVDAAGESLPGGVYLVNFLFENQSRINRMILLR